MSAAIVRKIFADVLTLTDDVDWSSVKYQETEGWDSLAHMAIIGELEEQYGIMLDVGDVLDMSSFDGALQILARYGVDVGGC